MILGGRVKICVDENGREQVLAVRGTGQLVGERTALQVSARSATVIALEMVWALVVRARDFAAFLSANPRVLGIVDQTHDRPSRGTARDGPALGEAPVAGTAATNPLGRGPSGGYPDRYLQSLNGENCTVVLTDVVGFGARRRTDKDRLLIREALFRMTHVALHGSFCPRGRKIAAMAS